MASVLGKRARTVDTSTELSSASSSVKRRACFLILNDKNAESRAADDLLDNGIGLTDSSRASLSPSSPCNSKSRSIAGGARVALSPRTVNGQVGACKNSSKEDQILQLPTPKTPRHRDTLSKRAPTTPRHKVTVVGKPITPRTPRLPGTSSPSTGPTVYSSARQLFTGSADHGRLIGREDERKALHTFLEKGVASRKGRCMYISGPPGTGKSALVSEICKDINRQEGVRTVAINCMSSNSASDIYRKLLGELGSSGTGFDSDQVARLRAVFIPRENFAQLFYVITLDEIDHLLTLGSEVLYTLFEWSLHRSSRLIVIGIANALDLTDRFLPRLKARNLRPQLLPFLPYTAPQITSVITTKLKDLLPSDADFPTDYVPFLHPTAIQLCSKKVASQSGDLRKAFDIIRRTIDLLEIEAKQHYQCNTLASPSRYSVSQMPLSESLNFCSANRSAHSLTTPFAALTSVTAPRGTIAHVSRVSSVILTNGTFQHLQMLNLQQKAALCALILHQGKLCKSAPSIFATPSKIFAAPTVKTMYETYSSLCKRNNTLHPLTSIEFVDVVSGLETLGIVGEDEGTYGLRKTAVTPSKRSKGGSAEKGFVSYVSKEDLLGCLDCTGGGALLKSLMNSDG